MTAFMRTGLLGFPVAHSMSPVIHVLFMEEAGIQGEYRLFPVVHEELPAVIHDLRDEGFTGLNVTVPHKKAVIELCTLLSEEAAISGAVNTLLFHREGIEGFNTDVQGFKALSRELPSPFMVLGKGGAAMAVSTAAGPGNCRLLSRGEEIPQWGPGEKGTIVNATPLGWNDRDPFPLEIPSGWSFLDLNYNPGWQWRNSLRGRGIRVITGERMLVEQAACSFALWTGYTPEEELKKRALERIKAELHG